MVRLTVLAGGWRDQNAMNTVTQSMNKQSLLHTTESFPQLRPHLTYPTTSGDHIRDMTEKYTHMDK